jgi:hypothetical protein
MKQEEWRRISSSAPCRQGDRPTFDACWILAWS